VGGELAATAFDSFQVIELFLETIRIAPCKFLITSGLDLCFACSEGISRLRGKVGLGIGEADEPYLSLRPWLFQPSAEPVRG
jgi:hypothetical protein